MSMHESAGLKAQTKGFALAAAVTVLFNTALAWAKDANPPLQNFMKLLGGHHWTTHGLADLVVFTGLGVIFARVNAVKKMPPERLIAILVGAVAVAALGLVAWFVIY